MVNNMATLGETHRLLFEGFTPTNRIYWGSAPVGIICWHDWPTDDGDIPYGEAEIVYFGHPQSESEFWITIKDGENPGDFFARVMKFVNVGHFLP